jgi:hypothetical protein
MIGVDDLMPYVMELWSDEQKQNLADKIYQKMLDGVNQIEPSDLKGIFIDRLGDSYLIESAFENINSEVIGKEFLRIILDALKSR